VQEHRAKKIEMLQIGADGHVKMVYDIRYSAALRQLACCQSDSDGDEMYQLLFANVDDGMQLSLIDDTDGAPLAEELHTEMTLRPFKPTTQLLMNDDSIEPTRIHSLTDGLTDGLTHSSSIAASVGAVTGLFTAPYGSHGLELLHVRLIESTQLNRWGDIGSHRSSNILAAADDDDDDGGGADASIAMMVDDVDDAFSDEDSDGNDNDDDEDAQFFDAHEGTQGGLFDSPLPASNTANNTTSNNEDSNSNININSNSNSNSNIDSNSDTASNAIAEWNDTDQHTNAGRIFFLEGLKITGDPNVPAGQLSFRVNATQPIDFLSWIADDPRPIVFFGGDGEVSAILMSERQANVRGAYRGFGQINRKPEEWRPEWVGLTFVLYTTTHLYGAFSVVWDDEGDYFRHLMDFRPFRTPEVCLQPPS
jgi:hypothetical protein